MPVIAQYYAPRPARTSAANLPFGVRSTGFFKIQPPYISDDKIMPSLQLFWCTRGEGLIELAGKLQALKHGQIAILFPGMRHYWRADVRDWEFYWLTLDGPLAVTFPAAMKLESAVCEAGPAPAAHFHALRRIIVQPSRQAEIRAGEIAFAILLRAAAALRNSDDPLVKAAVDLIRLRHAAPDMNVKTLAGMLGVRRAELSARFQAAMDMPPSVYLERLRVQNAITLLQNSRLPVGNIARQCGYPDANYFSRLIRRVTGESPSEFRQKRSGIMNTRWSRNGDLRPAVASS